MSADETDDRAPPSDTASSDAAPSGRRARASRHPAPTPARLTAEARADVARPAPHALARWSERRRRVAEAETGDDAPAAPAASHEPDRLAATRAAAEAIDPDTLGPGADVSALLREGVPDALRRRALKALWRSDPVFGNVDRLCDYDDDFRDPKLVLETLQSAWQAGRGYLARATEPDGAVPNEDAEAAATADDAGTVDQTDSLAVDAPPTPPPPTHGGFGASGTPSPDPDGVGNTSASPPSLAARPAASTSESSVGPEPIAPERAADGAARARPLSSASLRARLGL